MFECVIIIFGQIKIENKNGERKKKDVKNAEKGKANSLEP